MNPSTRRYIYRPIACHTHIFKPFWLLAPQIYATRTEIILMGVTGLSFRVGTLLIFSTRSYPSTTYRRNVDKFQANVICAHLYSSTYLPKDRVSGRSAVVEPVKEGVVVHIDKELAPTRLGTSRVGHRQGTRGIGESLVVLSNFIWDATPGISAVHIAIASLQCWKRKVKNQTKQRPFSGNSSTHSVHFVP